MSRSGYTDDCDENNTYGLWRGAVASAIKGKRGQAMLGKMAKALDALPEKRLVAESLVNEDGEFCALGALGRMRGFELEKLDLEDIDAVAKAFEIAPALAAEVVYLNDEYSACDCHYVQHEVCGPVKPHWPDCGSHIKNVRVPNPLEAEHRWAYMRAWVTNNLRDTKNAANAPTEKANK